MHTTRSGGSVAVQLQEPPIARMIVARAEKRLTGMIARRGIDDEVLALCGTYERAYRHALGAYVPGPETRDDTMALVEATTPSERGCRVCGYTPDDPSERVVGACVPNYHQLALVGSVA